MFRVSPLHEGIGKRYSIDVLLKCIPTNENILLIMNSLKSSSENFLSYKNSQQERKFKDKKVSHLSVNVGLTLHDIDNGNFYLQGYWVDQHSNRKNFYKKKMVILLKTLWLCIVHIFRSHKIS